MSQAPQLRPFTGRGFRLGGEDIGVEDSQDVPAAQDSQDVPAAQDTQHSPEPLDGEAICERLHNIKDMVASWRIQISEIPTMSHFTEKLDQFLFNVVCAESADSTSENILLVLEQDYQKLKAVWVHPAKGRNDDEIDDDDARPAPHDDEDDAPLVKPAAKKGAAMKGDCKEVSSPSLGALSDAETELGDIDKFLDSAASPEVATETPQESRDAVSATTHPAKRQRAKAASRTAKAGAKAPGDADAKGGARKRIKGKQQGQEMIIE